MNNQTNRAPHVSKHANAILKRVAILENPYFIALHDGSMSLQSFRQTQEQFSMAVTFFPRPMAALVARIPHPQQRLDILSNLIEEHGAFDEDGFHHSTFRQFLHSIGSDVEAVDSIYLWPAVRAFNSVLSTSCVLDELEVGIACMGIIEHAFAAISATIGQTVVQRGWVSADRIAHYKLHEEIDERHAEEFFTVIESSWDDPSRRYFIEQSLELGAWSLYLRPSLSGYVHRISISLPHYSVGLPAYQLQCLKLFRR